MQSALTRPGSADQRADLSEVSSSILKLVFLLKIVASFSSNLAIVCFNCDDQIRFEFNLCVLHTHIVGKFI